MVLPEPGATRTVLLGGSQHDAPQLGVESGRRDHATGAETYRERRAFQVSQDQPARGLESTAAPADVHWVKDADVLPSRQTPGGGSQTVVPYNQHGGITPKG